MSTDSAPDVQLEIGHVLFMDVVGYSKLLINDQREDAIHDRAVKGVQGFRFQFNGAPPFANRLVLPLRTSGAESVDI